jgi:ClpX C4-type zinc finger
VALEDHLLNQARDASDRLAESQQAMDDARTDYHQAVRRLHLAGGSLRDIAEALELSYQRVHQIIQGTGGLPDWRHRSRTSDLACSFCGCDQADAGKIIVGPGVQICAGCVGQSRQAHTACVPAERAGTVLSPVATGECSFCGAAPGALVAGASGRICVSCVDFCGEILSVVIRA